ncbi:MAG: response regulator, partial [Sulfurimonas sp.]|nr:response regulator [Sulfurimonas sp.]
MSKEKLLELSKKAEGLKLLYVEDNKGLQQQALKVFGKIFQDVTASDSAEEALASFKKNQPQIVISDISMGKLNGLEMAKIMKKIEPSTKIIITSAYDDKEYLFEAIEANVSKFLKKPISIVTLIEAIEKVTDEIHFEKNKDLF